MSLALVARGTMGLHGRWGRLDCTDHGLPVKHTWQPGFPPKRQLGDAAGVSGPMDAAMAADVEGPANQAAAAESAAWLKTLEAVSKAVVVLKARRRCLALPLLVTRASMLDCSSFFVTRVPQDTGYLGHLLYCALAGDGRASFRYRGRWFKLRYRVCG